MTGRITEDHLIDSVNAILKVGVQAPIDWARPPQVLIDEATRRACDFAANPLRASIVADPLGKRRNTRDNTPAMIHQSGPRQWARAHHKT